ncbi:MAG: hypothetical protein FWG67_05885 [Defluviitaleaceae bacterium]|nr:hypothetical protein [Defluviitaleaceae bacterium]
MYQSVITLKKDLPQDVLEKVHRICNQAFNNRAGKLLNKSTDSYHLIYEDTEFFGALALGQKTIYKSEVREFVDKCSMIDKLDPEESCADVFKVYTEVYKRNGLEY